MKWLGGAQNERKWRQTYNNNSNHSEWKKNKWKHIVDRWMIMKELIQLT